MVNEQDVADTELIELTKNPITETKFNFKKENPFSTKKTGTKTQNTQLQLAENRTNLSKTTPKGQQTLY